MTITFVRSDNEEELKNTVVSFLKKINNLSITLNTIGIFPGGVVFYEPKVTMEILQLHKEFSDALSEIATAITIMNDKFYGVKADKFIVKLRKCFKGKEIASYTIGY